MNQAAAAESEKKLLQVRRGSLVERSPYLYVLPATLMFVGLVAYPILWVIGESFRGANGKSFVGFGQYMRAFSDPVFWRVLRNMFYWGAITIPVQMLLGGSIAYLIERHTARSRTFFRVMFFLPVVTSVSSTGTPFSSAINSSLAIEIAEFLNDLREARRMLMTALGRKVRDP